MTALFLPIELGKDRIHDLRDEKDLPVRDWGRRVSAHGLVKRFNKELHARLHLEIPLYE